MGKVENLDKARRARGKAGAKGDNNAKAAAGKSGSTTGRRRCPICRKPAVPKFRPFCSVRCANVDLGRWIGGDYRIPETRANALNSEDEEGNEES